MMSATMSPMSGKKEPQQEPADLLSAGVATVVRGDDHRDRAEHDGDDEEEHDDPFGTHVPPFR
jgi:hypothetical protein